MCHFKSEADKRKALASLPHSKRAQALDPYGLAELVRAKEISERNINRLLLKVGGLSRSRPPREASGKTPFTFKMGAPFLTSDDGPATLIKIAQALPQGFRHPSKKAKKWASTSLLEMVCGVKSEFVRSKRGDKKVTADAEHRDLVAATQDIRNVPDKFLTGTQRLRKAMMPKLAKAATLDAIRERHALARTGDEPVRTAA